MRVIPRVGLKLSILIYAIFHFTTYFYENNILILLVAISGISLFVLAAIRLKLKYIKMPFGLILVGIIVMLASGTSMTDGLINGFLEMRNMVGLLIIVPMISWVLNEEPYIDSIMSFAHNLLDTSRKFYFGIASFTQIIAYFLLFGSISMMYQFVNMILKDEHGEPWENYKGTALIRGFALSVMWVVSIPSFAFVVEIMGASLGLSILQGLVISSIGIMIALIFSHFEEKRYGVNLTAGLQTEIDEVLSHTKDKKQMHRNVIEFAILFITLFGSILILQAFSNIELLVLIPLVVFVWIILYFIVKRRPRKLIWEAKKYVDKDMEKQAYQLCVMLGAGVLIYGLNQTGFAAFVVDGIYSMQEAFPFLNVLYFLPFIVIVLGFFGLGPLTVMVLVGGILETINLPYPAELIVLAVTSGSTISILLSPLIMPVIILSSMNGQSALKNGIGYNWKFAIVIYVLAQVWIQVGVFIA
ncbi:hypothetical protein [Oceanobacillus bengalensis]|uniref:Permease n=1 Tax=Oceanobacillus bengalensis TaxID=1435466 RepID=A0A494YX25_9BACI|nr:hypothetical protein [Oceanobacillus bengalensis]RKQ14768.1 hypothetical protein D8M05_12020 [Oceanobacillus bengalensis]